MLAVLRKMSYNGNVFVSRVIEKYHKVYSFTFEPRLLINLQFPIDISCFRPPTKLREDNVFTRVCLSINSRGESHVTIIHDSLDLTVQLPPPHIGPHWTGTPVSDIWWPSLGACSNLFTSGHPPVLTSGGYSSTTVGASGQYASYWNVFLFYHCIHLVFEFSNRIDSGNFDLQKLVMW